MPGPVASCQCCSSLGVSRPCSPVLHAGGGWCRSWGRAVCWRSFRAHAPAGPGQAAAFHPLCLHKVPGHKPCPEAHGRRFAPQKGNGHTAPAGAIQCILGSGGRPIALARVSLWVLPALFSVLAWTIAVLANAW